jgi:hypothetical protein
MITTTGLQKITSIVMADGRVTEDLSTLEDLLRNQGLHDAWVDAGRIATAELGCIDSDNQAEFQQKRNCLFLRVLAGDIDLDPMLAVWGLN